jgi:hypothetical protein
MARGHILQHSDRWAYAQTLFARVAELVPDDPVDGLRAREEEAWCKMQMRELEEAKGKLEELTGLLDALDGRETDKARCWWRLGKCCWELDGTHARSALGEVGPYSSIPRRGSGRGVSLLHHLPQAPDHFCAFVHGSGPALCRARGPTRCCPRGEMFPESFRARPT